MTITHLVISGGGVKGIVIAGVLKVLEERGIEGIHTFIGTSIGGLVSFLIAIGYTHSDLYDVMYELEMDQFFEIEIQHLLTRLGLDRGERVNQILRAIIKQKGVSESITFQQFYEQTGKTLILNGSNMNRSRVQYFSPTLTPDMPILVAVRITISFPIIFTPVEWEGDLFIDGALFDPFPIHLVKDVSKDCVLGILIENSAIFNKKTDTRHDITNFNDFGYNLVASIMNRYISLQCPDQFDNVICIDCSDIFSMNFGLTNETKLQLYQKGIDTASAYFGSSVQEGEQEDEQDEEQEWEQEGGELD